MIMSWHGMRICIIKKRTILSSLRYQNAPLLISQNSSKTSLNSRGFKNSGPTLWNSLPPTIRSIRSHKIFINLTSYFLSAHNHYIILLIIFVRVILNVYHY